MIEVSKASFYYPNTDEGALNDVSLQINSGECVVLCGKSGCGKTTLTRLLNGLAPSFFDGKRKKTKLLSAGPVRRQTAQNGAHRGLPADRKGRRSLFVSGSGLRLHGSAGNLAQTGAGGRVCPL